MDATAFLAAVLPREGLRVAAQAARSGFRNYFGRSDDWLIRAATTIDESGETVYIACASYAAKGSRRASNVLALRAFWLDIDTQESSAKATYANRKQAFAALEDFVNDLGLPVPTVVSSGYGLHVWWPLTEDIDGDTWHATATLLKAACVAWGLAADPSRTCDRASVLRLPGTRNFKRDKPRLVGVVQWAAAAAHADLKAALSRYLGKPARALPVTNELTTGAVYAPSSAVRAAQHCGVLGHLRDTRGHTDQSTWYHALGVVAFAEEGDGLAHAWSDGHPDYTPDETDAKLAQARQFAPTTCAKLGECQPAICAACPHRGTITSPISLGTVHGEPQVVQQAPAPDEPASAATPAPALVYPWGYGYGILDGQRKPCLWRTAMEENEEKVKVPVRVFLADVNLYPVRRIEDTETVGIRTRWRMHTSAGLVRDFVCDNALVAKGGKDLMGELGKREVVVQSANTGHLQAYMQAWLANQRDKAVLVTAVQQFGWSGENFVIGEDMITPAGTQRAALGVGAQRKAPALAAKGDLATWVGAVDRAYNHPGQEALQFCVLTSFAAPLMALWGEPMGVTVFASSFASGMGKTTAQKVGMSAWGFAPKLMLNDKNFTENALYGHMGVMNNLPVVVDELTNVESDFASRLVFSTSAGSGKVRQSQDGVNKDTLDWTTIVSASGNNLLSERISRHRPNAQAELARLFEFRVNSKSPIPPAEALDLFATFADHHGHAGRAFATYLVKHRGKVRKVLFQMRQDIISTLHIRQEERYWSALHACVLTALGICRKLGILSFDFDRMVSWIGEATATSREEMTQSVAQPLEVFADCLADLWRGVLVTEGNGALLQGASAPVVQHPQGPVVGRSVLASRQDPARLYLSINAIKEWAAKHNGSYREMLDAMVAAGWCKAKASRRSLGAGTRQYSDVAGSRVLVINTAAVQAATGNDKTAATVVAVINGGRDGVGTAGRSSHS